MLALLGLAGAGAVAVGLPADLFGSAPRQSEWIADATGLRVVDGETLRLGERVVRLAGLKAPQRGQSCRVEGHAGPTRGAGETAPGEADCGTLAATALAGLLGRRGLTCRLDGFDRFGRGLGHCLAGETELNQAMVAGGWALADAGAPPALRRAEATAREAGRGFWAAGAVPPAGWRD
ncbi:thermonuclease family protein [Roseomonas sp. NAR14]|uniref:Thermonuclease family protein n=1 Tax=Roseomonas acroporae TaxID=2937791 RepID=A0A9X1YCY5_9PROT|nr:thermonuclease family protein [Roseomonas acroporae]MCK8787465.1 thermonuclease family protein [Roseomonas acroporae]